MNRPKIGFLGVGWIGLNRMQAMICTGAIDVAAICDPAPDILAAAMAHASAARSLSSYDDMLAMGLDGIAIATPSALHAEQAILALASGAAVFCQKPLGRNAGETQAVVDAARAANRSLAVDFSYRHTAGITRIRDLMHSGKLGEIYAIDLVFHNAYGPDKPWFYDKRQSGGGCMMDLGIHLIDLALWIMDFPNVVRTTSHLSAGGHRLAAVSDGIEDFAVATLLLDTGTIVRLACSWGLHAGCESVIAVNFYGNTGGAGLRNINGSFYDFTAEHFTGTSRETLTTPPDPWGGKAASCWAEGLVDDGSFDPAAHHIVTSARVLDEIYVRAFAAA